MVLYLLARNESFHGIGQLYSCSQRNHLEDGHTNGRNILVTILL